MLLWIGNEKTSSPPQDQRLLAVQAALQIIQTKCESDSSMLSKLSEHIIPLLILYKKFLQNLNFDAGA